MANPLLAPTQSYEDTAFVVGDSGTVLDFFADLGGRADGYFVNDGASDGTGNIVVELLHIPTGSFGGLHTLRPRNILHFEGVARLRLTHVTDSAYRCLAELARSTA